MSVTHEEALINTSSPPTDASASSTPRVVEIRNYLEESTSANNETLREFLALAKAQKCTPDMKLDLSSIGFSQKLPQADVQALADVLSLCKPGLQIDLSYGSLDDTGATTLLRALKIERCPSGLSIDLSLSRLTDTTIDTLIEGVETLPPKLKINLKGNLISLFALKRLALTLPDRASYDSEAGELTTSDVIPDAFTYAAKMLALIQKLLSSEKLTEEEKNAPYVAKMREYLLRPSNQDLLNVDMLEDLQNIAYEHLAQFVPPFLSPPKENDERRLFTRFAPKDPDTVFCRLVADSSIAQVEAFVAFIEDRPAVASASVDNVTPSAAP